MDIPSFVVLNWKFNYNFVDGIECDDQNVTFTEQNESVSRENSLIIQSARCS